MKIWWAHVSLARNDIQWYSMNIIEWPAPNGGPRSKNGFHYCNRCAVACCKSPLDVVRGSWEQIWSYVDSSRSTSTSTRLRQIAHSKSVIPLRELAESILTLQERGLKFEFWKQKQLVHRHRVGIDSIQLRLINTVNSTEATPRTSKRPSQFPKTGASIDLRIEAFHQMWESNR